MTSTPGLERLRRWQAFGGRWQVVRRSADEVTVALCQCDGPEVERFVIDDAETLAELRDRDDSESAP